MVFFSFWQEPVGFLFAEYLGVLEVFCGYLFCDGDCGGFLPCPCLWPGHGDLSFFPIDSGVEGSQPRVAKYYLVFS